MDRLPGESLASYNARKLLEWQKSLRADTGHKGEAGWVDSVPLGSRLPRYIKHLDATYLAQRDAKFEKASK